jgi:hypothetical protein
MPRKVFTAGEVLAAADVNSFLMDQSVMSFAGTAARGSAIGTAVEGMVTYLEDSNLIQAYNSTAWTTVGNAGTASYNLAETVYFTSSGTFTKATYPWLRAIRVRVQGAGGGGGGCAATTSGTNAIAGAGGGGVYAESFITNISGLGASITVTRGAGGAGGAAGVNSGSTGGASSFGALVSANGGTSGEGGFNTGMGVFNNNGSPSSATGTGDLVVPGGSVPGDVTIEPAKIISQPAGASFLSAGNQMTRAFSSGTNGSTGNGFGGGGSGAANCENQATAKSGGAGANGIVIVELYA